MDAQTDSETGRQIDRLSQTNKRRDRQTDSEKKKGNGEHIDDVVGGVAADVEEDNGCHHIISQYIKFI